MYNRVLDDKESHYEQRKHSIYRIKFRIGIILHLLDYEADELHWLVMVVGNSSALATAYCNPWDIIGVRPGMASNNGHCMCFYRLDGVKE